MAFLSDEIPNEAFEYIKLMVGSSDEDEEMHVIPNPTTKKFWLAARTYLTA